MKIFDTITNDFIEQDAISTFFADEPLVELGMYSGKTTNGSEQIDINFPNKLTMEVIDDVENGKNIVQFDSPESLFNDLEN